MHKKLRMMEQAPESRRSDNVTYSEELSRGRRIKTSTLADLILWQSALCDIGTAHSRAHD